MTSNSNSIVIKTLHLPYRTDSDHYFQAIRSMEWPIWLDSGKPNQERGRYDILAANPVKKLISDDNGNRCLDGGVTRHYESPWQMLRQEFVPDAQHSTELLPFRRGAMVYLGYDLGRQLEQLPIEIAEDNQLPLMLLGLYEWALIQDHHQQQCLLTYSNLIPQNQLDEIVARLQSQQPSTSLAHFSALPFSSNTPRESYEEKIADIQAYISAGDCYQVNFAQRFEADYQGDPFTAYMHLRQQLPSPFSAYFETEFGAVLSLSPEQFLQSDGSQVTTKPIKGTCARGSSAKEDRELADTLRKSAKNQAENLMIVDLLRNDLSKVCSPVTTTKLFELESYANVHHLVSTITATLNKGVSSVDLLQACFPGGSITGAPKIRAMQIIEEQEMSRRSVYCGSIGYLDYNGKMDTNIAIRTLIANDSRLLVWGGGGIVFDSSVEDEYQETLTKIGLILKTISEISQKR